MALLYLISGGFVYGIISWILKPATDGNGNEEYIQQQIIRVNAALMAADLKVKRGEMDSYIAVSLANVNEERQIYKLEIPHGLTFDDLTKEQAVIENVLKTKINLINKDYNYFLLIEEEKKLKAKYPFEIVPVPSHKELFITAGMTVSGPLTFNVSRLPHILLAGTTGAGKSRILKSILCNLIENYTPEELQLAYLDNKGTECGTFKNVKHLIHRTTNIHDTVSYLNELEHEMVRRNRLIESKNKTNIVDYNKVVAVTDRIPFRFVIVDELFPFLTLVSKEKNAAHAKLGLLLSMSRAAGIHFILASQKSTVDILPTLVTTNCTIVLALRCRNEQESRNAIGETGLEKIDINAVGRGVAVSHIKQEFQSFWVEDRTIEAICSKYAKKRAVTASNEIIDNYKKAHLKAPQKPKNDEIEGVL